MLLGLAIIGSICLANVIFLPEPATSPGRLGPRIRGLTPGANALLASGSLRSVTFARLIEQLEATDVVVYVEMTPTLPPGVRGRLTFMTQAGGVRYLRVQIPAAGAENDLIAIAGHELQHALEVARDTGIRSSAEMAAFYRRVGLQGSAQDRYDTAEARIVGRRVRAELG